MFSMFGFPPPYLPTPPATSIILFSRNLSYLHLQAKAPIAFEIER